MVTDYRNKKYCPTLDNVENDKEILYKTITQKHQNAEDIHPLVADKEEYYAECYFIIGPSILRIDLKMNLYTKSSDINLDGFCYTCNFGLDI